MFQLFILFNSWIDFGGKEKMEGNDQLIVKNVIHAGSKKVDFVNGTKVNLFFSN